MHEASRTTTFPGPVNPYLKLTSSTRGTFVGPTVINNSLIGGSFN